MKMLVCGDVHIGRASSRVPESIAREQVWTVRAWHSVVDLAIRENVDLLCLTGDVADQDNRFWEAIGPLEQGIASLAASGIRTVAVSGNHDHEVLGRLADSLDTSLSDDFTLLGRGGTWQRKTIHRDGCPVLHIDGWSFPSRYVERSPLDDYTAHPAGDVPVLGMVHGDLDDPNSRYAPLDLTRLRHTGIAGWFLGHVHAPRLDKEPGLACVLYPGSPQAMDPGEPGAHGAWIVQVGSAGVTCCQMKPLSSVRYHELIVDLEDIEDESVFQSTLVERVRTESSNLIDQSGETLLAVSLRLRLIGKTALSHRLPALCDDLAEDLQLAVGTSRVGVETIMFRTTPPLDLEAHAKGTTAVSELARLLLELDQGDVPDDLSDLIRDAGRAVQQVCHQRDYMGIPPLTDGRSPRDILREQAAALLGELVGQA